MAKIARPKQNYDLELAEQGLMRTYRTDIDETGKPIYREVILKCEQFTSDPRPWWKKAKKSRK